VTASSLSIDQPASAATLHVRAREAWGAGDTAKAFDLLRQAVAKSVDLELLNDFGVAALERLGVDAARAVLGAVLAVDPERADATQNLAVLDWRSSETLGGPDARMPERAFPGMPNGKVMAEHARRYAFALDHVQGARVLDLGCGTGYGSELLTWGAASVQGFDLWQPAAYEAPSWPGGAQLTWGHDLCSDPLPAADVAVAFEVLEHLADAPAALRLAWNAASRLVVSFPNPVYHGSHHNPYHVNDWPLDEVERQLRAAAPFAHVELDHYHQGADGLIRPGRDPEASYWLVVAHGVADAPQLPVVAFAAVATADNRMKREWDARARENAMHFIASGKDDWTEEEFSASGRINVQQHVVDDRELVCAGREPRSLRALEIGCGIGRMSEHLAGFFGTLTGVDVSGEMIRRGTERLAHLPNVQLVETDGASLPFPDASFDVVFSFTCFQHVPTKEAVIGTLRDAFRVLAPGGIAKFQVQGSQNPHYIAAVKDTWQGETFSAAEMAAVAAELGFEPLGSEGADSQYFWHWWRKP
jgi:ubiquinone/menaquinone biosynthesis C-methylase UbiE